MPVNDCNAGIDEEEETEIGGDVRAPGHCSRHRHSSAAPLTPLSDFISQNEGNCPSPSRPVWQSDRCQGQYFCLCAFIALFLFLFSRNAAFLSSSWRFFVSHKPHPMIHCVPYLEITRFSTVILHPMTTVAVLF